MTRVNKRHSPFNTSTRKWCSVCLKALLCLVAQLDVHPTGDQEIANLTLARSATFFREDLIMKYFLQPFSPFNCFKKGSCQNVHNTD